ncbi:MAG: hypothetical protein RLZZ546_928, partial [Bacteroidota bacterium]
WTASVSTPGHKICFTPTSGHVTSLNDGPLVNFCITGVDDPTEVPQYLNVNYYSNINQNDTILCDTLLRLECEDADHPCVIIKEQTVECDTANNKYIITMYVENHSSPAFTATELLVFSGPSIVPYPITFSPPLASGGPGQTVMFCYVPPVFPEPSGQLVVVYKLRDALGNCCEGGEIFYDTIQLPSCGPCKYNKCDIVKYQFDVEDKPLGDVPLVIHTGIFPVLNNPQIVNGGCNGSTKSVELRGVTRGYAGEAIGVKSGGFAGQDTLGKKNETCCLTFCKKMKDGLASNSTTLEVYVKGFLPGESQLVGYYTFSNDASWDETQIFFTHTFNARYFIFRNVTSDPLDGPPSIFIDDIRIGKAVEVIDNTPPVITCPSDIIVSPTAVPCVYNYTFPTITATDDHMVSSLTCMIDGGPAVAGTVYPLGFGLHYVECIAMDSCGNADTCLYTINVDCHPTDTFCHCPTNQTKFTMTSGGVNYTLACNQSLSSAPILGCLPQDVKISGAYGCQSSQDTCESRVEFNLDRPGSLSNFIGSSTIAPSVLLNFNAADVSAPGLYTLTISTVCPGTNDTCRCVMYWIQSDCDSLCACTNGGPLKPNLVTNGQFSLGNTGFTSDMIYSCSCSAGTYCVDDQFSDKCGFSWPMVGGNPGNFLIVDGFTSGTNLNIWGQNVSVTPCNTYKLCFETASVYNAISQSFNLNIGIEDGSGIFYPLATELISSTVAFVWTTHTVSITVPCSLTGPFKLKINQSVAISSGFSDFGIDNICFTEEKQAPLCKCGGFSGVKFCVLGSNPISAECNLPDKVYNIPCPSSGLINFCGRFKCVPDTCTPTTVNFTLTNLNTSIVVTSSSLLLTSGNSFSINLLSGWFTDPTAIYEISMKGLCGNDTCICKLKIRVDCPPDLCKCNDKFFSDVAQGYLQSSLVGNCLRKFEPRTLCPGDRVDWYRNGTYIATTSGLNSQNINVGAGYNTVCMVVTRTESPNKICKDTFCSKTFCIPEAGPKSCGSIENASIDNWEDDFLTTNSTIKNWMPISGLVYAFANEGISDGNIMLIASKELPSEVWFRWTPIIPRPQITAISMDIESYISTPIPQGSRMEVYAITPSGQRVIVSNIEIGGYRKGWDGSIKGGIANVPDDAVDFSLRVVTNSNEQIFVRIDNVCFDLVTSTDDSEFSKNSFTMYPNPTTGILNLQFAKPITSDVKIEILDLLGRIILTDKFESGSSNREININEFTNGIYVLKLIDKNGELTSKKVIKVN